MAWPQSFDWRQSHMKATTILAASATLVALSGTAHALSFNNTFATSLTSDSRSAQFQAAIALAEAEFTSRYTDNITINLTFQLAAGTGTLGSSSTPLVGNFTFAQIQTMLTNDATTADDATAVASLGTAPPTGSNFLLARAQAKALGQIAGNDATNDGTITFGAGHTYTFDPNNRAVSGAFDFIGVAMHEISETMGRIGILGFASSQGINDLYRYSGNGVRALGSALTPQTYFSLNSGATNLVNFNTVSGGDSMDYASTADAFNAFTNTGIQNNFTTVGQRNMDVIGYDMVPEPASMSVLALGALAFIRRKKSK